MGGIYAEIAGWGKYLPATIRHNRDFECIVDTNDAWIRERTGIVERRLAGPEETTSTMAASACREALAAAGVDPAQVEFIVLATATPDYPIPATACQVQDMIGAPRAAAIDVHAGCTGFVYALVMASALVTSGLYRNALVVGAETLSRIVDATDRQTCILFGDGAGAVFLRRSAHPTGLVWQALGADGAGAELLYVPAGGARLPASAESVQKRQHYVQMKGRELYRLAVHAIARATRQALDEAGLTAADIHLFLFHQANLRLIQAAAAELRIPPEKLYTNLERYGNTSAASIPIALCEAIAEGRVGSGDYLAMIGFGAGFTWGVTIVRWG